MGRRRVCPLSVVEQVVRLRHQGLSYRAIGEQMEAAGVPTPEGHRQWFPNTSAKLLVTKAGLAAQARLHAETKQCRPASAASDSRAAGQDPDALR
jgi:hypothetical protein